jgi:alpha-glucosidase
MFNVLTHWMDRGADGFRIDAINHMFEVDDFANETYIDPEGDLTFYDNLYHNHTRDLDGCYEVVFEWRAKIDEYARNNNMDRKFLMTEAYAEYDLQIKWYGNETTAGSHMPFNFALIANLDRNSNAQDFQDAVQAWYSRLPTGFGAEANWVLGNHDRPRIGYRYGTNRHESLAMMTMLLPGINVVYYVGIYLNYFKVFY